jgi:riboflavin synthase alpha subunit
MQEIPAVIHNTAQGQNVMVEGVCLTYVRSFDVGL